MLSVLSTGSSSDSEDGGGSDSNKIVEIVLPVCVGMAILCVIGIIAVMMTLSILKYRRMVARASAASIQADRDDLDMSKEAINF